MAYTIIRGGRVLDIRVGTADAADILIEDDIARASPPRRIHLHRYGAHLG